MIVFRLILVLALTGVAGLLLAWMFTKDRKYLRIAGKVLRFVFVLAIVVALIFVAERIILN